MSFQVRKPKIKLFTCTKNPLEAIALAIDVWHHPVPSHILEASWTETELIEKFRWLLKQPHQGPFEYFHMVWVIENCSRAFQQQLTRHRIGFSYSIQSLRVVDPGNFADEGRYTRPSTVCDPGMFDSYMRDVQCAYRDMIRRGFSTEDARGILPLNIHSPITMACTYRSLLGLMKQRFCIAAQEEWQEVVLQMRKELEALNSVFVEPMDCMCKRFTNGKGFCKTLHKEVTSDVGKI